MNYEKLRQDINFLAGETIENASILLNASNRALRDIYHSIKVVKTERVAARGMRPITYFREVNCHNGQEITLPANGLAYSMRIHGSGRVMITDGEDSKVIRVDSPYGTQVLKGRIYRGTGSITFWGSFSFYIYDYAIYDDLISEKEEEVPECGPTVVFDIRELFGDFMSFISPALDREGKPIKNCRLHDGKLEVDAEYKGEIMITYRRLPRQIVGSEGEAIDLPEEYSNLLSLLAAHYALINSNEPKAKYFKSLYDDGIELVTKSSYDDLEYKYPLTNSWA